TQYGSDGAAFEDVRERVRDILDELVEGGFVEADAELGLSATPLGSLTSRYYLRLATAVRFHELTESDLEERTILRAVARAEEFDSVSARQSEREAIREVLGSGAGTLEPGAKKVLAIMRASMDGSVPPELRSDAWVIRQNALRLIAALGAFFDRFDRPEGANLARRLEARIETAVPERAVGLTALDGVGSGRGHRLAEQGITSPGDVREVGVEGLTEAGLSTGVAENVVEQAESVPAVVVDWGGLPETIERGENRMIDVTVRNRGEGARLGIRVTVNGIEMTTTDRYVADETTVPVGVFGAEDDELTYVVTVAVPDLPLRPVRVSRTVHVVD
ncbi:MAG: DEAD/DEAH box helicase, partial [Halodesulfurarchaeum sp.]